MQEVIVSDAHRGTAGLVVGLCTLPPLSSLYGLPAFLPQTVFLLMVESTAPGSHTFKSVFLCGRIPSLTTIRRVVGKVALGPGWGLASIYET